MHDHSHPIDVENAEIPVSQGMSPPVLFACFLSLALIVFMLGITAASSSDLHWWPWTQADKVPLQK